MRGAPQQRAGAWHARENSNRGEDMRKWLLKYNIWRCDGGALFSGNAHTMLQVCARRQRAKNNEISIHRRKPDIANVLSVWPVTAAHLMAKRL